MTATRPPTLLSRAALAGCALMVATGAAAGDVTLKTAWMRPAGAGSEAQIYVDIVSDTDLVLVGATTPVARKVELIQVTVPGEPSDGKVVSSMPVPGGQMTRLAYRGSHLRLVEITKDLGNGTLVPVTLAFKTPEGKAVSASFEAQVRGMLTPRTMPARIKPIEADPPQDAAATPPK
jgi:copper(I)-binding protein